MQISNTDLYVIISILFLTAAMSCLGGIWIWLEQHKPEKPKRPGVSKR